MRSFLWMHIEANDYPLPPTRHETKPSLKTQKDVSEPNFRSCTAIYLSENKLPNILTFITVLVYFVASGGKHSNCQFSLFPQNWKWKLKTNFKENETILKPKDYRFEAKLVFIAVPQKLFLIFFPFV